MSAIERHLRERLKEHNDLYAKVPSMGQFYPTLLSPSRDAVTLRFRGRERTQSFINFSSSNYLCLNKRPEVRAAHFEAFDRFGSGANGSPVLSGYYEPHGELEQALARLHGTADAILFSSGYAANLSVLSACLGPNDMLVFDSAIHGSIIDGAKLAGTRMRSFAHNDPEDLRKVLKRLRAEAGAVVVATLGIFSMSGDIAPLPEIVRCAREYDALVLLDEAHAVGVLGATGRGTLEHFGLDPDAVDFCVGTLSKTFAGVGGYVSGSRALTEFLRFAARPHVLSAAIPPTAAAGCLAAVRIFEREGAALSSTLRGKADAFRQSLTRRGIRLLGDGTGVAAFSVSNFDQLWRATEFLFERGVFLNPVVYPAVRKDEGRLRFYLNVDHSDDDLARAADVTVEAFETFCH